MNRRAFFATLATAVAARCMPQPELAAASPVPWTVTELAPEVIVSPELTALSYDAFADDIFNRLWDSWDGRPLSTVRYPDRKGEPFQ